MGIPDGSTVFWKTPEFEKSLKDDKAKKQFYDDCEKFMKEDVKKIIELT